MQLENQSYSIFLHSTAHYIQHQHSLEPCLSTQPPQGTMSPCFTVNLFYLCFTHWNKKGKQVSLLPHPSEMQGHPSPQIKYFVLSGIIRLSYQNPPAGRGIQQRGGSPQRLRGLLWIKQKVDFNWREQFNLLIEGEKVVYLLETICLFAFIRLGISQNSYFEMQVRAKHFRWLVHSNTEVHVPELSLNFMKTVCQVTLPFPFRNLPRARNCYY